MALKFNPFTSSFDYVDSSTVGAYSSTPVANGLSISGTDISLHKADATYPGALAPADWTTFNNKQSTSAKGAANGYASLDSSALIPVNQIPPSALERLVIVADQTARYALTTTTVQNGDTVKQTDTLVMYFVIDDTNLGNSSGYAVYNAGTAAAVAWGGITSIPAPVSALLGTNTGDVTIGTTSASSTANGASISGQVLTLHAADITNPGLITAGTQSIAGAKTFTGSISASNLSGTNTGNVSIGTANGLSLSTQQLSLSVADTSNPGALSSSDWNTFNGKQSALTIGNLTESTSSVLTITGGTSAIIGSGLTVQVKLAATGQSGYLSSTDWNTFNGKASKSSGDIAETSFSGANNQSSVANVTGLAFANATVRSFEALVSVYVDATTDLFEAFTLIGIQKGSSWNLSSTSVGDTSGYTFSITNAGQVQYVSTNETGFSSATVKFRAITTSV